VEPGSTDLVAKGQQPAHRRIFEGLRRQILAGKFAPGTQLPGTRELAVAWQSSMSTAHTALQALTREGWVDRRPNAGTYIADPKKRFLCAGIYQDRDIGSNKQTPFSRNLHFSLLRQVQLLKKDTQVFIDERPDEEQGTILPSLAKAMLHRRIQCLVVPSSTKVSGPALARLALPTAFLGSPFSPNRVAFDTPGFLRESVRSLKAQGCRSIGLISDIRQLHGDAIFGTFYPAFQRAVQEEGLITKDEWILSPSYLVLDGEDYGYQVFKSLWKLRQKPDGLIVYSDMVVRGVILAILELGIRRITRQTKFVFHRNAHLRFICPFPVTWATSDEDAVARELVHLILKQFKGEETSPVLLPYTFEVDEPQVR
jgi:DNA-binding LacI/PurR family transcriptional regulator